MAKTKAKPEVNLLDELAAYRARIAEDIHNHDDIIKTALSNIDGALSHLESARWQVKTLGR